MKRLLLLFLIVLLLPASLLSKDTKARQYWGGNFSIGYANNDMFNLDKNVKTTGRVGIDVGAAYEYFSPYRKGLWLTAKFGFQFMQSNSFFDGLTDFSLRITDTRGFDTDCHYRKFSGLKETQNMYLFNPMFMIGYHSEGFYFGGGVKAIIGGMGGDASTTYITSASYDQYIDDFENMDDHYYKYHEVKNKKCFSHNFLTGCLASFEIGGYFTLVKSNQGGREKDPGTPYIMKFGFFMESGPIWYIANQSSEHKPLDKLYGTPLYFENPTKNSDATELKPLSYYQVNNSSSHLLHSLYAGVRLTLLLTYSGTCVRCNHTQKGKKY